MNSKCQIVALGEILWDVFPDRICFGGAPANYACAVSELGKEDVSVSIVSGVGKDDKGMLALEELRRHSVKTNLIQHPGQPTGQVDIQLNSDGSANYDFAKDVAWDNLQASDKLLSRAAEADAICFGTLGQRSDVSAKTIQAFVAGTRADCLRVFDINLRFPFVNDQVILKSLELANILKLNDEELPYLANLLQIEGDSITVLQQIEDRFGIGLVALTQGSSGALLKQNDLVVEFQPAPIEVVDTVGAGDAFTATLTLGLLHLPLYTGVNSSGSSTSVNRADADTTQPGSLNLDSDKLQALLSHASQVAAFVCTQPGATPVFPDELITKYFFA